MMTSNCVSPALWKLFSFQQDEMKRGDLLGLVVKEAASLSWPESTGCCLSTDKPSRSCSDEYLLTILLYSVGTAQNLRFLSLLTVFSTTSKSLFVQKLC